jgi:TonB-dependent starch-binding outer membrane protein SusC
MVPRTRQWLAIMAGLVVMPLALAAQERTTVTGTVRAPSGAPIATAQVRVVGTQTGAITDAAGNYSLQITGTQGQTVTLRASKLGHGPEQAQVVLQPGGRVTRNFVLAEQTIALDAVVVTGSPSGTATRREVANTVAQIPVVDVVDRMPAIHNVTAVLQSAVPGLQVMTQSGTEGVASRVRIRGVGSLNAGSAPIYVIDGVRMYGGAQTGYSVLGASQSALDAIHPQDIANIEVIKGPAAATLYGADGANGVISVTTKRGQPGQQRVQVTARSSYGEQEWTARTFTNYSICTPARVANTVTNQQWPGCQGVAPNTLISNDLLREHPQALRTGHTRLYHMSATGGGDRFGFYIGANHDNNDGVLFNNSFRRYSGRTNFTFLPSDRLDANVNVGYYRTDVQLPLSDNASDGLTRNANRGIPGRQNAYAVGWLGLSPTEINEFDDRTRSDRFLLSATVRHNPLSWFQHRVSGGFDYSNRKNQRFYEVQPEGRAPYGAINATGAVLQLRPLARLYTVDYSGTVSHDVRRDVTSELQFGAQVIANRTEFVDARADGLASNSVRLIHLASNTRIAQESLVEQSTVGFFVQEKIGWRDRLYVTAGLRTDDNSAFGQDFTFVAYPKLGVSWVISEEPFFRLPGVDLLRLRSAWGRAGNSPNPYAAERTYSVTTMVNADQTGSPGLLGTAQGNPNLTAEKGEEHEIGFDGSLLNGRVAFDFTYFDKRTKDALVSVPSAPSSGFTSAILQNVGQISNVGTELTVSVLPVETRTVVWESRLSGATLRNRLDHWGGVRDAPIYTGFNLANGGLRITPGMPLPQFFGTVPSRDPATGELLRNPNGTLIVNRDTVYFGGSLPTRTLSWDNNVRILRNLRVGAQLDHQGGHHQINLTRRTRAFDGVSRESILVPDASAQDTLDWQILRSGAFAQFIERADFVKLRSISASYAVPARFTRQFGSDEIIVTVSGRNLKTWTDYQGTDPETNADASDFLLAETNAIPPTRRITASVTVRF